MSSSPESQANPNGPIVKTSYYKSLGSIPEGALKAIGSAPYMNIQIIPIDATMGYESLTHRVPPTSTSYFEIDSAYPSVPTGTCTRFVLRKCDGTVDHRYIATDMLPSVPM